VEFRSKQVGNEYLIHVIAIKKVKKGTELLADYGEEYWSNLMA
jgi:hypothetical protein